MLEKINYPKDLKNMTIGELEILSQEIREVLIKKVNATGGHMGSNLGIIEATVALHYVFNSPIDKIVYDVSHQSYTHKILTGRKEAFINPEKYYSISGYTNPQESEHDFFVVGHTSTSISLASGLAKARDIKGEKGNVIAIIGDGSLSGGEALEGLNSAVALNSNMVIVINDNDMSIAENHGGLYTNLKLLRESEGRAECNFFKALGYDYCFIKEGNDIGELIKVFEKVKDSNKPVIIHMCTQKGKGLAVAEENKEKWHWALPNELDENYIAPQFAESYQSLTNDYLETKYREGKPLVVISAGTPGATGLVKEWRDRAGKHYTDVGIAEGHAVGYSSGIAKGGAKPVFQVFSSFIQRTYDQLSHDLALNNNPAVILVYAGGIFGGKGGVSGGDATHLGSFDISMIGNIPNLVYLAPTNKEEYLKVLDWAIEQNEYPVIIRVPYLPPISMGEDKTDYSKINRYKVKYRGEKVAIIALGTFYGLGEDVRELLKNKGIDATLINPLYITGMDKEVLDELKENHQIVITLEDGIKNGGFGEKIASYYGDSEMRVLNYGADKEFTDRVELKELYKRYHLTPELIVEDIERVFEKIRG